MDATNAFSALAVEEERQHESDKQDHDQQDRAEDSRLISPEHSQPRILRRRLAQSALVYSTWLEALRFLFDAEHGRITHCSVLTLEYVGR